MTREEGINKAAEEYCNSTDPILMKSAEYNFKKGAQWADEHSKSPWISAKDDLPCNHKDWIIQDGKYFSTRLCVVSDGINIFVNKMFNIDGVWKWGEIFEDVKFWFVIPSPCLN